VVNLTPAILENFSRATANCLIRPKSVLAVGGSVPRASVSVEVMQLGQSSITAPDQALLAKSALKWDSLKRAL